MAAQVDKADPPTHRHKIKRRREGKCFRAQCVRSEAPRQSPARFRRNSRLSPDSQKTFTSLLTGKKGWAYKAPIDAAADANGAKHLLGTRASWPDLGRETKSVLWRCSSSDGVKIEFEKFENGIDIESG
jgi:hypothetical protein